MAITGVQIEQALLDAIANMDRNNAFALVAVVEDERIRMQGHAVPRSTGEEDAQWDGIRIACMRQEAAFVILKRSVQDDVRLVLLTPETCKPKTRMLVAATAGQLKERSGVKFGHEHQISHARELSPLLFAHFDSAQLLTESERVHKEIAAVQARELEQAPQRVQQMMPMMMMGGGGGAAPDDAAVAALKLFADGDASAVVLAYEPPHFVAAKVAAKGASEADIVAAVPADAPRFVFLRWPGVADQIFFVYVVPVACKPKDKAPYMGAKMPLLAAVEAKCGGLKPTKRIEVDDPALLGATIKSAMEGNEAFANMPVAPEQKVTMVKGARMLMS